MRRSSMWGPLAGVAVLVAVPAGELAAHTLVEHGRGPTVTHDASIVDVTTQVDAWARDGQTRFRLKVAGLPPNRTFGAHVHTGDCGPDPLASGGHFQHSTDPSVPLEEREVWLDLTSDEHGRAVAETTRPWIIPAGSAGSVVIHAAATNPATGSAGARLLCTDVPFGQ